MSLEDRKSSKIYIAHTEEEGVNLCGVLEQLEPDKDTKGKRIALILHGAMGHKDYLFQKRLAKQLPMDSFRFDFRGSHESGGDSTQGDFASDVVDLQVVVNFLQSTYGYRINLLVGHSRGSIIAFRWLCSAKEAQDVSRFVNVCARYRMERVYIDVVPKYQSSFDEKGYYDWEVTVARQLVKKRIYPKDMEQFAAWDTSLVWDKFPSHIHVLTLHGLKDTRISPYDGVIYARALGNRTPGTHSLCLVEDADHNFTGKHDQVVETVLDWHGRLDREIIHTGVWNTGVPLKL